jgi:hypothetical protein
LIYSSAWTIIANQMKEYNRVTELNHEYRDGISMALSKSAQKAVFLLIRESLIENIDAAMIGYYRRINEGGNPSDRGRWMFPHDESVSEANRLLCVKEDDEARSFVAQIAKNLGEGVVSERDALECGLIDIIPLERLESIAAGQEEFYGDDEHFIKLANFLLVKKKRSPEPI